MTGARAGQVPGPRTSALVQEKLVPVLASPKIQFMSAFPFLEFLGPLEIGDIVWNTAGLTGGARCSSATVHPGPVGYTGRGRTGRHSVGGAPHGLP